MVAIKFSRRVETYAENLTVSIPYVSRISFSLLSCRLCWQMYLFPMQLKYKPTGSQTTLLELNT
jgi:hypothetical protein